MVDPQAGRKEKAPDLSEASAANRRLLLDRHDARVSPRGVRKALVKTKKRRAQGVEAIMIR
jgi:hypothetical protein